MLQFFKELFSNPNNQKFFGSLVLLALIIFVYKGEDTRDRFIRFWVLLAIGLLVFFTVAFIRSFS